jgi:hypothetical protein
MRALAPVVVGVVAVVLCGCGASRRPDAAVARAVERVERQERERLDRELTALAAADDELPVALPVRGRVEAQPDAAEEGATPHAAAEALDAAPDCFFSVWPEEDLSSYAAATRATSRSRAQAGYQADVASGRADGDRRGGLPNVRFKLFRFDVNGQPVDLKCTIKNKMLVFGAKIRM